MTTISGNNKTMTFNQASEIDFSQNYNFIIEDFQSHKLLKVRDNNVFFYSSVEIKYLSLKKQDNVLTIETNYNEAIEDMNNPSLSNHINNHFLIFYINDKQFNKINSIINNIQNIYFIFISSSKSVQHIKSDNLHVYYEHNTYTHDSSLFIDSDFFECQEVSFQFPLFLDNEESYCINFNNHTIDINKKEYSTKENHSYLKLSMNHNKGIIESDTNIIINFYSYNDIVNINSNNKDLVSQNAFIKQFGFLINHIYFKAKNLKHISFLCKNIEENCFDKFSSIMETSILPNIKYLYNNNVKFISKSLEYIDKYKIINFFQNQNFHYFQKILIGPVGSGKSYSINKQIEHIPHENIFRIVFYPDYTNYDFIGSINQNTFIPGTFFHFWIKSYALLKSFYSIENLNNRTDYNKFKTYLIIEELNRGYCYDILGFLAGLLDRENGISKYPVRLNDFQKDFIHSKTNLLESTQHNHLIKYYNKLPNLDSNNTMNNIGLLPNMNIICSMNINDDDLYKINKMLLRRFELEFFIDNNNNNCEWKLSNNTNWIELRNKINKKLSNILQKEESFIPLYFFTENDLFVKNNVKYVKDIAILHKLTYFIYYNIVENEELLKEHLGYNFGKIIKLNINDFINLFNLSEKEEINHPEKDNFNNLTARKLLGFDNDKN